MSRFGNKRFKKVEQVEPLEDNVSATLAYVGFPAVAFLSLPPYMDRPFVRFHSIQALLLWGILIPLHSIGLVYGQFVPLFGYLLWPFSNIVSLLILLAITCGLCMSKAKDNEMFHLPGLGNLADKYV